MPTFTLIGSVQFIPKLVDGDVSWSESVSHSLALANGSSSGQADGYWSKSITLASTANTTLDLTALAFTIFGGSGTVNLASIKLLAIVNRSKNVTITIEPGASDPWDQFSGAVIGQSGLLLMQSPLTGLPLGASSKTLKISNDGTVTTLTGNTTTGSGANTITGLSSTTGLVVGMEITGTGIPAGTKIASIPDSTTVVMTANATATSGSAGVSLAFAWPDAVVDVYVAGISD